MRRIKRSSNGDLWAQIFLKNLELTPHNADIDAKRSALRPTRHTNGGFDGSISDKTLWRNRWPWH